MVYSTPAIVNIIIQQQGGCVYWWKILLPLIPRIIKDLYGRILNLEFESLEMFVTEMYHNILLKVDLRL